MKPTVFVRFLGFLALWLQRTSALFFGALGGGGGSGCCMLNPCCGMSLAAPPQGGSVGGCGSMGGGGMFGGFSPCGGIQRPPAMPSYTFPTLPTLPAASFPTFPAPTLPQPLPLGMGATYPVASPTENSSGASPSYSPFSLSSNPPAPPPPPSSGYADIGHVDTIEKTGSQITGIEFPTDKLVRSSTFNPNDLYEEKIPNVEEDYGDVTSNRSEKGGKKNDLLTADYSDQSFAKTKVSGVPSDLMAAAEPDLTGDPKCSSETLRTIMQENIVSSPTISKQLIFSAGRLAFGQTIDVICSRNKFSYTVVVHSTVFCESSRGRITCFSFLQP